MTLHRFLILFAGFSLPFSASGVDNLEDLRQPTLSPQTKMQLQQVGGKIINARVSERSRTDAQVEVLSTALDELNTAMTTYLSLAMRVHQPKDLVLLQKNNPISSPTNQSSQQENARDAIKIKIVALKSVRSIINEVPNELFSPKKRHLLSQMNEKLSTLENSVDAALKEPDGIKQLLALKDLVETYQLKPLDPVSPEHIAPSLMTVTELDQ